MAAHIFDIDGTIVRYHTNEWLAGAKECILKLYSFGNQIIFITMRDEVRDRNEVWSVENTKKTILKELDDLNVRYTVVFGVSSPRTIHDDSQVFNDQRMTNETYPL